MLHCRSFREFRKNSLDVCHVCFSSFSDIYASGGNPEGILGRDKVNPNARLASLYGDMAKRIDGIRVAAYPRRKSKMEELVVKLILHCEDADWMGRNVPAESGYREYVYGIFSENDSTPGIGKAKSLGVQLLEMLGTAFETGKNEWNGVFAPNPGHARIVRSLLADLKRESRSIGVKSYGEFCKEHLR